MKRHSKRHRESLKLLQPNKIYEVEEAINLLKKIPKAKFDESLDISVKLTKKPEQPEQQIRTTIVLPKGTGKTTKVLVFAKGEKEKEARDAGADYVGAEDLIEKIKTGWLDFDVAIATPDMMKEIGKLGKILGTKGLMPNPKSGTVTFDVGKAVKEFKAGKVEFRSNKEGVVSLSLGKISFSEQDLILNVEHFIKTFLKLPALATKGQSVKSMYLSTTMGIGVPINFKKYL
ncbi:MAG: 50S ribosomal protein L1 [Candidatus Goldbacteria bacterium]|nr:50S ribosomal protein L1 [Candidatus Goldiibacteriota bacterium]